MAPPSVLRTGPSWVVAMTRSSSVGLTVKSAIGRVDRVCQVDRSSLTMNSPVVALAA